MCPNRQSEDHMPLVALSVPNSQGKLMNLRKEIILPEREAMLNALLTVDDGPWVQEYFYPMLLAWAGSTKYAGALPIMILTSIDQLERERPGLRPVTITALTMGIPEYIDALVSDDPEAAETAKAVYREITLGAESSSA